MCFPFPKTTVTAPVSRLHGSLATSTRLYLYQVAPKWVYVCNFSLLNNYSHWLGSWIRLFFNKAEDEDANLGEGRLYNFSLKPTVRGGGIILFFILDAMEKVGEKGCLKKCYCLNSGTSFGLKKKKQSLACNTHTHQNNIHLEGLITTTHV